MSDSSRVRNLKKKPCTKRSLLPIQTLNRLFSQFFFQGCYHRLTSWLLTYLNPVLITVIVLLSVEVVAVIFALCLCKGIERELRRK